MIVDNVSKEGKGGGKEDWSLINWLRSWEAKIQWTGSEEVKIKWDKKSSRLVEEVSELRKELEIWQSSIMNWRRESWIEGTSIK